MPGWFRLGHQRTQLFNLDSTRSTPTNCPFYNNQENFCKTTSPMKLDCSNSVPLRIVTTQQWLTAVLAPDIRYTVANTHERSRKWTSFVSVLGQSVLRKAATPKAAAAHLYQVLRGQQRIPNTNLLWTGHEAKPWGLPGMRGHFCSKMLLGAALKWGSLLPLRIPHAMVSPRGEYSAAKVSDGIYREGRIFMVIIIECLDFMMPTAPCGI